MKHVMIDLETLGKTPGCAILSIGAVAFNSEGIIEGSEFYHKISLQSCLNLGMWIDPDTAQWWREQSDEAREEAFSGTTDLKASLFSFFEYMSIQGDVGVWSNGADFDLPILTGAFKAARINTLPWGYNKTRCYRTLKNLLPRIEVQKPEGFVAHNALWDAKYQALHAAAIMRMYPCQ
jgi:hypothetical protein